MDYPTPRVAAADYIQKHLEELDLDLLEEIDGTSRDKALMRFHAETYLKRINKILNKAFQHKLIKNKNKAS